MAEKLVEFDVTDMLDSDGAVEAFSKAEFFASAFGVEARAKSMSMIASETPP